MRVARSFAFVDLSGFTAHTEQHGDEEAVATLAVFRATLREICSRRAVRIAKWLGDGAMLVGVDSTPLLSAVLELEHRAGTDATPMSIRCGVTHGPVILLEGDDYIGHAVNVAARLCDTAGAGEVLATPAVVPALPPWAASHGAEEIRVRGLGRAIPVVRLGLADPGAEAVPDPVCGIPLAPAHAISGNGHPVPSAGGPGAAGPTHFCSESCLETWRGRNPALSPD
jgi:adenylate cyclase